MSNSKKYILLASILGVLAIGIYFITYKSDKSELVMVPDVPAMEENSDNKMAENTEVASKYVLYTKEVLDQANSKRRVLFFYASWCPTCVPADANLKLSLDKIPEDVAVIRVNYNDSDTDQEEKDLARKYGITYQHTFVQIDKEGNEVTKWNGGQISELLSNIK